MHVMLPSYISTHSLCKGSQHALELRILPAASSSANETSADNECSTPYVAHHKRQLEFP